MTQPIRTPRLLVEHLRDSIRHGELDALAIRLPKHTSVYTSGDAAEMVYFIEGGQIKLVVSSLEGKECLLTICTAGDLFGESCLAFPCMRPETAMAMTGRR